MHICNRIHTIKTKEELIDFLSKDEKKNEWENNTIEDYLASKSPSFEKYFFIYGNTGFGNSKTF